MCHAAAAVMVKRTHMRVVVVGAGAFGGWTALELLRRGAEVTLVDAWGPGHTRSSSGGETRVIRAVYGPDRVYVEMVRRSFEAWDELASASGDPVYVETGALWMMRDDDAYVRSSEPLLREQGLAIEPMAVADAARAYPQIDFAGVRSVWREPKAGVLFARRSCALVRDAFVREGGTYRTARVASPASVGGPVAAIALEGGGTLAADAFVFACGPWLGQLFPDVAGDAVRPTRQEVYYFGTPAGSDRYTAAHLPVWLDFGERIFYGIPDVHGRGFKLADDTRGEPIDPTAADRAPTEEGVRRARELLRERFPELVGAPLLSAEVCQYENSPDGHLIIDRHPGAPNVFLAGGGSGHGFKLSPAVGEMVAAAVTQGAALPAMFALKRLQGSVRSTQFERRR
jgi:sarcosine oxidase